MELIEKDNMITAWGTKDGVATVIGVDFGHQNVYVSVKGKFILSKVANRICQDYGFQKVVVLYRTEVTKMEFEANFAENPEICCYCLS
jgi:hypothetical protein